jgi:hypothetical protein
LFVCYKKEKLIILDYLFVWRFAFDLSQDLFYDGDENTNDLVFFLSSSSFYEQLLHKDEKLSFEKANRETLVSPSCSPCSVVAYMVREIKGESLDSVNGMKLYPSTKPDLFLQYVFYSLLYRAPHAYTDPPPWP